MIATVYTVRHFTVGTGCCGGGGYKPKFKKPKNVICIKTFKVNGMHCKNCKWRVEEVIDDIGGVAAKANLKMGEVTVYYSREVPTDVITAKLSRVGYDLKEM